MIKNVDTSVITQTSSRLAVLEPCIKVKVRSSQARSTSYNVLVADCRCSVASLSYKLLLSKLAAFVYHLASTINYHQLAPVVGLRHTVLKQ